MEEFKMNTRIFHGEGCLQKLSVLDFRKVYIICDPFMEQSGKVNLITEILEGLGTDTKIFAKVVPDPSIEIVAEAMADMAGFEPEAVIAFGGGSAIDTAKAVCHIISKVIKGKRVSLIAIPTTSGTGSEVTSFSVISDHKAHAKYPLVDEAMLPDVAFLDPQFTVSVPSHITADTGMDVLTHAVEAYVSVDANDFTDACAEKAIQLVFEYLERAVKNGEDIEARLHLHNASCLAGIAFNGASLGICHSMAHALGGRFHIPHGKGNAMLLPHIIGHNAKGSALMGYARIAKMLGIYAATEHSTVSLLIQRIHTMMKKIGIPWYVTELGVTQEEYKEAVPDMAEHAALDKCTLTNPGIPAVHEFETLYMRLLKGGIS